MLEYASLKKNPRKLSALTGLTMPEIQEILPAFEEVLAERFPANKRKRQRAVGGGRKPKLSSAEDKLLFILVYTKTYPLQVVQGEMFGMSQPTASQWIGKLLPILAEALDRLVYLPERDGDFVAVTERPSRPDITDRLRAVCLALPDTKETLTWGEPHFRVGEKPHGKGRGVRPPRLPPPPGGSPKRFRSRSCSNDVPTR